MIEPQLTKICIGNKFKQGYITSIISSEEIVFDNGKTVKFVNLEPIEFTIDLLKNYGYSTTNKIHHNAKIFVLEDLITIDGETFESGIYIADKNNNIISNRIKFEHEFQNLESMLIDTIMPFS